MAINPVLDAINSTQAVQDQNSQTQQKPDNNDK